MDRALGQLGSGTNLFQLENTKRVSSEGFKNDPTNVVSVKKISLCCWDLRVRQIL